MTCETCERVSRLSELWSFCPCTLSASVGCIFISGTSTVFEILGNCPCYFAHVNERDFESFWQYTWCILNCVLTYKEFCHKCIRCWYFSWPTLKYTDHYTDLIHPGSSVYLSYTNRYTDCVRPEEGSSVYRPFYAVWDVKSVETARGTAIFWLHLLIYSSSRNLPDCSVFIQSNIVWNQ